ncbi:uncharacterized protein [Diadema antillarum]|uniref:uncharacterized protein n=1 Tax=Diadema antillarum TaxID=105358 RepID=UPI003A83DB46
MCSTNHIGGHCSGDVKTSLRNNQGRSEATPRVDSKVVPFTTGEAPTKADLEATDMPNDNGLVIGVSIVCAAVVMLAIIFIIFCCKRQKREALKKGPQDEVKDTRQHSDGRLIQNQDAGPSQPFEPSEAANTYELIDRPDATSASPKDLLLADSTSVKQELTVSRQSQPDKAALSIGDLYAVPMKEGKKSRKVDTYDKVDGDPTTDGDGKRYENVSKMRGDSGQAKEHSVDSSQRNTPSSELNGLSPMARDTAPLVSEGTSKSISIAEISYEAIDDVFTSTQPLQIYEDVRYDDIPNGNGLTSSGEVTPSGGKFAKRTGKTTAEDIPAPMPTGNCKRVDECFRREYDSYESVDCNAKGESSMSEDARHATQSESNRSTNCPTYAVPMKDRRTVKREDSFDDSCMVMNEIYSSCSP